MSNSTENLILSVKQSKNFRLIAHLLELFFSLLKYTKNSSLLQNFKSDIFKYATSSDFTENYVITVNKIENLKLEVYLKNYFSLFLGILNIQQNWAQ